MWSNPGLIKAFKVETAIAPYSLVTVGAGEGSAIQATNGSSPILGAAGELGVEEMGLACDVTLTQIETVCAGGSFPYGALVTAGAEGKAVAASGGDFVAGMALAASTAEGDLVPILLSPVGTKA